MWWPMAGGPASHHQDHLVSSFGAGRTESGRLGGQRPAWWPGGSAKTSWNPAVVTRGTGWPVTGELIVKRASPSAAIAVSSRLCDSFTGHGMSGPRDRASPEGVPIRWNLRRRACWHEDATWLARHGGRTASGGPGIGRMSTRGAGGGKSWRRPAACVPAPGGTRRTADDWNGHSLPARGRGGRQPAVTLIAHSGWSEDRWWR